MNEAKQSRLTAERFPASSLSSSCWVLASCFGKIGTAISCGCSSCDHLRAVFHLRYAVIAGWTYSLSSVAGADYLIGFTATTAIISLAIPWWVIFTLLGIFKLEPRRAAEIAFQPVFAVLILLSLPIGWSFALNGPLIGWTLPDMPSMFLGFLSLLQALVIAASGIILSGATAFFAWLQTRLLPAPVSSRKDKVKCLLYIQKRSYPCPNPSPSSKNRTSPN